jgi:hypothetical protein
MVSLSLSLSLSLLLVVNHVGNLVGVEGIRFGRCKKGLTTAAGGRL